MTNSSFLERIFSLQERVLSRHISTNSNLFSFISETIELLANFGITQEYWDTIPVEMKKIFDIFHSDIFSTLVSATRLCLQGCDTDALALMQVTIEDLTILDYIATERLYHNAFLEIQENSRKGKNFSDKFSYAKVVKAQNITDRRERLRGKMSAFGSHASPSRLSLALVYREGSNHPKPGLALNNPQIPWVLGEIASLCLFTVRVYSNFFITYLNEIPVKFLTTGAKLEEYYEDLNHD